MKFSLTIDMNNEAFDDVHELSRILKTTAIIVDGIDYNTAKDPYDRNGRAIDLNGNTVGKFKITGMR